MIEACVRDVIVAQLGVDPARLGPSTRLADDLGADSLDLIEIVLGLEAAFDLEIAPELEVAPEIHTVADTVELVLHQMRLGGST